MRDPPLPLYDLTALSTCILAVITCAFSSPRLGSCLTALDSPLCLIHSPTSTLRLSAKPPIICLAPATLHLPPCWPTNRAPPRAFLRHPLFFYFFFYFLYPRTPYSGSLRARDLDYAQDAISTSGLE
jgi:hypothetical protein